MILLDTHALVWATRAPHLLSKAAQAAFAGNDSAVSAVSFYEIALKARRGRWNEVRDMLDSDMEQRFTAIGIRVLPVTGAIMQAAGAMDWAHRDPFDRLIVASAEAHRMPVVSKDVTLDGCGLRRFERVW